MKQVALPDENVSFKDFVESFLMLIYMVIKRLMVSAMYKLSWRLKKRF